MQALHTGAAALICAALICASLFGAGAAFAGDDGPDVESAAKKASSAYQKSAEGTCSSGACTVTFPKVPSGKVLETTNFSCNAKATSVQTIPAFATLQGGNALLTYLPLNPFSSNVGVLATGAQGGTVYVDKGKVPSFTITGATAATCTLSGRLVAN